MTTTANNARMLVHLVRAVARLALPASDQLAYLRDIGVGDLADELALDLDATIGMIPTFVELGWLTTTEVDTLRKLDGLLESMSGPDDRLWSAEGLTSDTRWEDVRQCARSFLFHLGQ